jgi:hypothetical protein
MCFGTSQKGNNAASSQEENLNSRPVPYQNSTPSKTSKMPQETYAPPPGPPPGYQNQYVPPPGPPPTHQEQYAPPPGPPPSRHNWQEAVPDTSLLPPPPSIGYERSPTNNATESEANTAEEWLRHRPLQPPLHVVDRRALAQVDSGDVLLCKPPGYSGELRQIKMGSWKVKTKAHSPDSCMISNAPLYSVEAHSPLQANTSKTIYFEVKVLPGSRADEISLGLGFVALPYPPFRLPGWERAGLGVHGDDGHRYVNDKWGGRDFTQPFKRGQTVGIGMSFSRREINQPPAYGDQPVSTTSSMPINVEVFFTRDGKKDSGWNIHEELDASEDLPVTGLEGMHDLYAAVGIFDAVEFEVNFVEKDWLYRP